MLVTSTIDYRSPAHEVGKLILDSIDSITDLELIQIATKRDASGSLSEFASAESGKSKGGSDISAPETTG